MGPHNFLCVLKDTNWSLCVILGVFIRPEGFYRILMGRYSSICVFNIPYGSLNVLMRFYGFYWVLLGFYEFFWVFMRPYGSLCDLMDSNGSLCLFIGP